MQFLKASATQNVTEMEMMSEVELTRLKRQYRIMENDRMKCTEEGGLRLRNQQIMIARLEYEKAELLLAIRSAKSKRFIKKDEVDDVKLKELFDQRSKFIDSIKFEKDQISELKRQIGQVTGIADIFIFLFFYCYIYYLIII